MLFWIKWKHTSCRLNLTELLVTFYKIKYQNTLRLKNAMSVVSTSMGWAYSCREGPLLAYQKFMYALSVPLKMLIVILVIILFFSAQCELRLFDMPWYLFYYSRHKHLGKVKWIWNKINSPPFKKWTKQSKQKLFKWWSGIARLQPCTYLIL